MKNEKIDINAYFVEQYIKSFKNLEIVPVDYIEMKQIYENESEELKGIETLKLISKLSGKKLLVEGFPDPWVLSGSLIAAEEISPQMLDESLSVDSTTKNRMALMETGKLKPQRSLGDFF
jgi:hypothetical protein